MTTISWIIFDLFFMALNAVMAVINVRAERHLLAAFCLLLMALFALMIGLQLGRLAS